MAKNTYYVTCNEHFGGDCEGDIQEWFIEGYDPVPKFILCEKHAAEFGFCTYCGGFIGGTEDVFLTGQTGLCFDCFMQLEHDMSEPLYDEDDPYYDD